MPASGEGTRPVSAPSTVTLERPLSFDTEGPELDRDGLSPPPPHNPVERELAMRVGAWEVRVFGGRKLEYFVSRGFWHLQLWHPDAGISILTPSRLTRGLYEAFPIACWKIQAPDYDKLISLLQGTRGVALPAAVDVLRMERALVRDVVRASGLPMS